MRPSCMKRLAMVVFAGVTAAAFAQAPLEGRAFVRIPVYHGDPYLIKSLIEGISVSQPELSTILGFAGVPDKDSDLIESIFGQKGTLRVNPTDNSILFFPLK